MVNSRRKHEALKNITNKTAKESDKRLFLTEEEEIIHNSQMLYDRREISMVDKYSKAIFKYFRENDSSYVYTSNAIPWTTRSYIIDWIIGIHEKLNLSQDTLYLTVYIIDKFLLTRDIPAGKLYLVGISALMISCKLEEVVCPTLYNLVVLSENRMSEDDIKKAEKYMLHTLNYDILFVSPLNFLRKCSKANNYEIKSRNVAKYILELSLLYEDCIVYPGSIRAAAAMYLARKITQQDKCKNLFLLYSEHTNEEIRECFNKMIKMIAQSIPYENIQAKYDKPMYSSTSSYVKEYANNNFY